MLAEELKEFREIHKLTQRQFCKVAGLKRASYAQYETGRRSPTSLQMLKIELGQQRIKARYGHQRAVERYEYVKSLTTPKLKKNQHLLLKWICFAIIIAILVFLY